jgi:hypothetical protein
MEGFYGYSTTSSISSITGGIRRVIADGENQWNVNSAQGKQDRPIGFAGNGTYQMFNDGITVR